MAIDFQFHSIPLRHHWLCSSSCFRDVRYVETWASVQRSGISCVRGPPSCSCQVTYLICGFHDPPWPHVWHTVIIIMNNDNCVAIDFLCNFHSIPLLYHWFCRSSCFCDLSRPYSSVCKLEDLYHHWPNSTRLLHVCTLYYVIFLNYPRISIPIPFHARWLHLACLLVGYM